MDYIYMILKCLPFKFEHHKRTKEEINTKSWQQVAYYLAQS